MSDEKKKYVFYSIIVLIIVSILACLFLCSGVQDNGAGVESVREHLAQLKQLNEKSQKELSLLKTELEISKTELNKAKQQSIMLQSELTVLKKTSQMQTDLLQGANASLKTYASEEKKKMQAIKNQRNVAYGVGAVLLYALVRK